VRAEPNSLRSAIRTLETDNGYESVSPALLRTEVQEIIEADARAILRRAFRDDGPVRTRPLLPSAAQGLIGIPDALARVIVFEQPGDAFQYTIADGFVHWAIDIHEEVSTIIHN